MGVAEGTYPEIMTHSLPILLLITNSSEGRDRFLWTLPPSMTHCWQVKSYVCLGGGSMSFGKWFWAIYLVSRLSSFSSSPFSFSWSAMHWEPQLTAKPSVMRSCWVADPEVRGPVSIDVYLELSQNQSFIFVSCSLFFLFTCCPLGNSNKSKAISHYGFSLHSSDGWWRWALSIQMSHHFKSSFENNLLGLMPIFKQNSSFFLLGFFSPLHFLDINPLHDRGSGRFFSCLVGYLFGLFGLLIAYSLLHISFTLWCFTYSICFCFLCLGQILAQSIVLKNFAFVFF